MKSIAFIIIVLFTKICSGQESYGSINYELKINNRNYKFPIKYLVVFKGGRSIEIPLKVSLIKDEILETSNNVEIQKIKTLNSNKIPFVYKDFNKNELFYSESIFRNQYLVSDTLNNFNWKITNETRKIDNYTCTKAETKFRGREFEAWFSEEIAVPFGPWKFCG